MTRLVVDNTAGQKISLVYCDYIAQTISANLKASDTSKLLSSVGAPQYDLTPEGCFISPKKTIYAEDRNGRIYKITVELEK